MSNRVVASSSWRLLSAFALALPILIANAASAAPVVRAGSAAITNDDEAGTWTISSSGASLLLDLNGLRDFAVVNIARGGTRAIAFGAPDTLLRVNGQTLGFGSRAAGFVYDGVTTSVNSLTVQLDAIFQLPAARLRVTRHYAATSGSPVFETWTTVVPLAGAPTLADLNGFRLTLPAGTMHWLNGLQGDDPQAIRDNAFTLQHRMLAPGERLSLGATGRSSETTVPWIAIDSGIDEFVAGLLWSGAWSLTAVRSESTIEVTLGLSSMTTAARSAIDTPHAFFGLVRGGFADVPPALRAFLVQGVRGGRPLPALTTWNTWFAYGVEIDDAIVREEIDGAAALGAELVVVDAEFGAELVVVDAGWYVGAGRSGADDFTSGLGTWEVDTSRFPDGLGALTEYAHSRGLKFGLWVEPERVALSTIGRGGLAQESWLAKSSGQYQSSQSAQICLASAAARQWVFAQLTRLLDSVKPDYLKWDNNLWVNCDRGGHGHGTSDGNFAHVNGLYELLAGLRAQYPDLVIENVSGGGNRLDLGMLRYTDVAWMDDRTAPSVHVRHIVEGLSVLFPPAYLLSFVVDHESEPIHDGADLPLYFRSRMTGVLGFCFRTAEFGESENTAMAREIDIYKTIRDRRRSAAATLLTAQADPRGGPAWDVMQIAAPGGRTITLAAFQFDQAAGVVTVTPRGLAPNATYEVRSVDAGLIGTATGAELTANGISLAPSPSSGAHILLVERR